MLIKKIPTRFVFAFVFFNGVMFGLIPYIAQQSEVEGSQFQTALEGLQAIKWMFSAPACQINNFCYTVEGDAKVGSFVTSKPVGTLLEKYTEVITDKKSITVSGDLASNHKPGEMVFLYKAHSGKKNQLCIGDFDCYSIPTDTK